MKICGWALTPDLNIGAIQYTCTVLNGAGVNSLVITALRSEISALLLTGKRSRRSLTNPEFPNTLWLNAINFLDQVRYERVLAVPVNRLIVRRTW